MEIEFSIKQLNEVVENIISQPIHKVILFNGMMGVGKTTLIKELCKALGVKDATSSPTFSLVNEYATAKGETIYHFDVYRLKKEEEAYDMGMDEYLHSGAWNFIEWSEKIPNLIPENYSEINLTLLPNGNRKLVLKHY